MIHLHMACERLIYRLNLPFYELIVYLFLSLAYPKNKFLNLKPTFCVFMGLSDKYIISTSQKQNSNIRNLGYYKKNM